MRNLCVMVGLALASGSVLAADFGIGISARSDDGWLHVPIDLSKKFRVEPGIRYVSNDFSYTSLNAGQYESKRESDQWELGVGLFGLQQVSEEARLYYGARLAYVDSKSTDTTRGSASDVSVNESDLDGYRIGPTVGVEYVFGGHFSVGGEVSYTFVDLEGESRSRFNNSPFGLPVGNSQESQGTDTRLIFRYMF